MEFNKQALPADYPAPDLEESMLPAPDAEGPSEPAQSSPTPPGRARLQQLHTFLVEEKADVPEDYHIFEEKLLEKPERLRQLHDYLVKEKTDVPAQYGVFEEKMTEGLESFKKKGQSIFGANASQPGGSASSPGGPTTSTDLAPDESPPAGDQPFEQVARPAVGEPATVGVGQGSPPAEPPANEGLINAQDYPAYLAAHPEKYQQLLEVERTTLDKVPDGYERVALPPTGPEPRVTGTDEEGTYRAPNSQTGQRYIDRLLSKEVAGEGEQGLGLAAARNMNNLIADGFKGLMTAADDATQLISSATGLGRGGAFKDAADALETTKKPVAPFYQSHDLLAHPNAKNLLMATSDVAGMAIPLVAQALAPEAGLGAVAARVAGTGAGLMFDGQILQGAHDKAVAAGMSPDQVAAYTFLEGGLSVALFKGGSAVLGKAAGRLTPGDVKSEIMRETYRLLATREGKQLTRQELAGVLQQATAAAAPRLLKVAAEGGKLGTLFGVNEAKNILTESVARHTIGAKFTAPTLGEAVKRVVGATTEGALIGGATGAVTPAPPRTLPLGRTPDGRALSVQVNETGAPVSYVDQSGAPVDFGKVGPPPAVQQATQAALEANPAPLAAEQLLSHHRIPISTHNQAGPLFADFDQRGQPTKLYNDQGKVFRLDDPQVRQLVESKWPGASAEAGAGPAAPTPHTPAESLATPEPVAPAPAGAGEMPTAEAAVLPASVPPIVNEGAAATPTYGTPSQNRAAGRFEKDGQTYARQPPLGDKVVRGKQATAEFSAGVQQPVHYAIMEAADLQPSHLGGNQNLRHFLPEAQPKNRSAAFDPASQKAIADIAASPDLARLGEAPNAYSGAPIVNPRGEALQGNGRAAGIREHYQQGGESYKRDVVAAAEQAGIPASETARFQEPVLVRIADVSDQRARELGNYTAADTESGGKRRLDARQASGKLDERSQADLTRLATPQGDATLTETLRANGPELLRLLRRAGAMNETQLQTMVKADGSLTPQGVEDLAGLYRHQLFADGDPNLPELFAELPAAAQGGLDRAGGALLGLPESASLVPEVQQAIGGVRELLSSGADFATWAGQADMFRGGQAPRDRYSPLALRLIELLATEKRPTVIARYFQEYAAAVRGEADSLFGATPAKSRAEASQQVFGAADNQNATGEPRTESLFQLPSTYEQATAGLRDAGAEESPTGQRAADQRPAPSESRPASGSDAPAGNAARPRVDAGDTEPLTTQNVLAASSPPSYPADGAPLTSRPQDAPLRLPTGDSPNTAGQDAAGVGGGHATTAGSGAGEPSTPGLVAGSAETHTVGDKKFHALNDQLQQALASGDQAAAAEHFAQAEKLAQKQAARGPESGRASTAFRILAENAPAAIVHVAEQEAATQRAQAEAKLEKQAAGEGKQVRQEKAAALDYTLATPVVRAAREKIIGKAKPTTKEQVATVRAERASLVEELKNVAKTTGGVAYSSLVPLTPAQARAAELHLKIFRTYIREGVVRVQDLVARWKREAGPLLAGMPDAELTKLATTALTDHRAAVRQGVADLGTTLNKIVRDYTTDPATVGKTLAQHFVEGAGLSPAEAQQYADAIRQEFDKRMAAARQRRLDQLTQQAASGAAKPTHADLDRVRELFSLAPTDDAAILDHLRRATVLPGLTPDEAAHLRTLAEAVTAAPAGFQKDAAVGRLLHATAQLKAIDWLEVANSLWYANVLSGYKTHGVNLFANSLQTGAELLVHTAQALATGKGRYATASAKGLVQGLHRGAREAISALTTGREVSRDGVKFEEPGLLEYRRFAGGAANPVNYLKFVGRALRAGDVLFSTGLKEMRAHELAVKEALAEGTDGEPSAAVWARVNEKLYHTAQRLADARSQATAEGLSGNDHARRVFEIAEQSRPVAMREEAREYGTRAVFNGDVKGGLGWATEGIQHITQGIDIAGFKPAKYVVPFTRVIANVANALLDYTPVGAARAGLSLSREQLGRGSGGHLFGGKPDSPMQRQLTGEERGHLAIKSVFGAAVAVTAYALTHNQDEHGNPTLEISGAGTGTPSKDAQLRADGWQPYSIKAGGKWYSYANTPVGIMLSVIGNLSDGEKYRGEHVEKSDEALSAVALNSFRALQFTKDMTALKGAADFLAAADSKSPDQVTRWAQRLAVGTVKGYVPWSALLTQVAKDGEQLAGEPRKQARSFGQSLVQDIPVVRNGLHDALDVLGDALPIDTDRLISSAPYRDAPTRAVWDWLEKNDLFITVPNRNSGGAMVVRAHKGEETPMSDDEYFAFMHKRGQLLKEALQHQLPELQKLEPTQAKKQLQQVVKRVTKTAKQQVFATPPVPVKK